MRYGEKYIHDFFQNFLKIFLVGLHGFAPSGWFAPDMLPSIKSIIFLKNNNQALWN
jgi:hypothetical protein